MLALRLLLAVSVPLIPGICRGEEADASADDGAATVVKEAEEIATPSSGSDTAMDTGCTVAPGAGGAGSSAGLAALGLVLALSARRRRGSCRS